MRCALLAITMMVSPLAVTAQEKPVFVTEATYGLRMAGGADKINTFEGPSRANVSINVGAVKPLGSRVGLGAVATAGIWNNFYLAAGPRLRVNASPKVAIDLTPSVIIAGSNVDEGHFLLDAAAMYRNKVGFSVQVASFRQFTYAYDAGGAFSSSSSKKVAVYAGLRLGSTPGLIGIAADALTLVGAFALYAIACGSGSGCD